ncbi:MAG: hypothetical protein JEZ04_13885 [Spirochaetales bacterium]|nr:hypothetical protein [Spirochaetales bacterium]
MKNIRKIGAGLLLVIILVGAFTGCEDLLNQLNTPTTATTMTIAERIASFSAAINATDRDAASIQANFGPEGVMEYYGTAADLSHWQDAFPAEYNHAFEVTDSTDSLNVVVSGTTTGYSGNSIAEPTYKFVMYQEASGNFLIQEIYEDGTMLIRKIDF